MFAQDRWQLGDRLTATAGARYTYVGFLPDSHHADAVAADRAARATARTVVRGSVATRTLAPGGDLLTLSTVAASPAITWARLDDGPAAGALAALRARRRPRRSGPPRVGAHVFDETTRDVLLTTFDGSDAVRPQRRRASAPGASASRSAAASAPS